MNTAEKKEKERLEEVKAKLTAALHLLNSNMQRYAREIREEKAYLWENKTGMDHVEKISVRQSVGQAVMTAEAVLNKSKRIQKLIDSPYFGRFDFIEEGQEETLLVYVGIHTFFDEETEECLVFDWRAPISTMFYDYEMGVAQFEAPDGAIWGKIILKRQYRIRQGEMEYMLESDLNIHDDILQKELSNASDDKMKNIVATIQRDQNAIIRNENASVLIIQGVAGSGKTSIALHRIAFLLYRFKDTIKSKDMLIISPNKVFADYISNVLPELGEEEIPEMGIEELAKELLSGEFKFQTFFHQVAELLDKNDPQFRKRIEGKASTAFLEKLKEYMVYIEREYFCPDDVVINGRRAPESFIKERFKKHPKMPLFNRLEKLAGDIEHHISIRHNYGISAQERNKLKNTVRKMFRFSTLRSLYKDFYQWLEAPELFKPIKNSTLEYSDVFPMIYLKMRCEGLKSYVDIKHLLVDEMQDYTPVQYAVLADLFPCKKTILGDANQSVNPFSSSRAEEIQEVFTDADYVKLNKSYRSTYEITKFAQNISPNDELEVMERYGQEPSVRCLDTKEEELEEIKRQAAAFTDSDYHAMGIICRTQKQAEALYQAMESDALEIHLLTSQSAAFAHGVIICTAHMAKGLEFDCVLVPEVSADHYKSPIDKSMLYVACTRAMHRLAVTYVQKASPLLNLSKSS